MGLIDRVVLRLADNDDVTEGDIVGIKESVAVGNVDTEALLLTDPVADNSVDGVAATELDELLGADFDGVSFVDSVPDAKTEAEGEIATLSVLGTSADMDNGTLKEIVFLTDFEVVIS